ncbi:MAG: hypothetical protein WC004_02225 [Candidatus Absconditabacterales bacterium]
MLTPSVIENHDKTYEGDLVYYVNIVLQAKNVMFGYHNIDHMFHVTGQLYDAIGFYKISGRTARNLLIAGLFHDYNHSGGKLSDSENIAMALQGLHKALLRQDKEYEKQIGALITATEWPHKHPDNLLAPKLLVDIMRDADMTQCLSPIWIKDIIFGLQQERGKTYKDGFASQLPFLKSLTFRTQRAQQKFAEPLHKRIQELEGRQRIIQQDTHAKNT